MLLADVGPETSLGLPSLAERIHVAIVDKQFGLFSAGNRPACGIIPSPSIWAKGQTDTPVWARFVHFTKLVPQNAFRIVPIGDDEDSEHLENSAKMAVSGSLNSSSPP